MANILGISIGTRNVGLAVIKDSRLRDFGIRTFPGAWSREKLENIWKAVETYMKRHEVTDVMVKMPRHTHISENIVELKDGIRELGKLFNIEVHECTLKDIRKQHPDVERFSKQTLVEDHAERYPELQKEWGAGKKAKLYNKKLFESIACAELAARAGH